ncbi:MAG TPA: hypothetical protein PKD55_00885 [Bellilinea sp.]|nr:hypothetical protein [Bellilinea sp.]
MDASDMARVVGIGLYEMEDGGDWLGHMMEALPRGEEVYPPRVAAAVIILQYVMQEGSYDLLGLSRIEAIKRVHQHHPWLGLGRAQEIVQAVAVFDDDDIITGEKFLDLGELVRII